MDMDFSHLNVEFFTSAVHNVRKSAEEKRPVYDDIEMVKIRIAGDPKSVVVAPAHSQSSARDPHTNERLTYAQLHHGPYDAFKRGQTYIGSGTPLSELVFLTEAKRRELQGLNIHTAEQLAALDGANLNRLGMGARELKTQAENYLKKASGLVDVSKLQTQIDELMARLNEKESGTVAAEPALNSASPFADWDEETLTLWIVEQGGEKPHHKCSHATLVAKADELNAALAKSKAA